MDFVMYLGVLSGASSLVRSLVLDIFMYVGVSCFSYVVRYLFLTYVRTFFIPCGRYLVMSFFRSFFM